MAAHWSLSAEQPRTAGHHEISEALRQFEHRQRSLISGTFRVEASARLHNPAETHESHVESGGISVRMAFPLPTDRSVICAMAGCA